MRRMTEAEGEVVDPTSLFRILVSTDVHLGYGEKNEERAEDSFRQLFRSLTSRAIVLATISGMKINVCISGHLLSSWTLVWSKG